MTTTHPASSPFLDFWEDSALHALNVKAFGTAVVTYAAPEPTISSFAAPGRTTALKPIDDRTQRLFAARRSGRTFSSKPLREREVAALLAATGATAAGRIVPSAGGLNPVHTFAIGMNVQGPGAGRIVRYNAEAHTVSEMGQAPTPDELEQLFQLDCDGCPQLMIVLVVDPTETMRKYGTRAGRFLMQEVGHAAQNISLRLAADKLTGYVVGGALDQELLVRMGLAHTPALIGTAIACGR